MGSCLSKRTTGNEPMKSQELQSDIESMERQIKELSAKNEELQKNVKNKDEQIEKLNAAVTALEMQRPTDMNSIGDDKMGEEMTNEVSTTDAWQNEMATKVMESKDGTSYPEETYECLGRIQKQEFENDSSETANSTSYARQQEIDRPNNSEKAIREVQQLNERIAEKNKKILELEERIEHLEHQQLIQKQIKNVKKLRELEKITRKSEEIEEVLCKVHEDTTYVARLLTKRETVEQPAAAVWSSADSSSLTGEFA